MLKLSYSTNGLTNVGFFEAVQAIKQVGYEGAEISFQKSQFNPFELIDDDLLKVKNFFEANNISPVAISSATTFFLSDIPHEPSIIALNKTERQKRIDLIKRAIQIAKKINCPIVSFQSGYLREEHIDQTDEGPMKLLIDGIKECLENIENITLVIEPEPGMFIESNDDAITLINKINSPSFRLHLDIGHAYCTEKNYIQDIEAALPYIEYMHLADIKEGYNLRIKCINDLEYFNEQKTIDLDFAGRLYYLIPQNLFFFFDKNNCICFYDEILDESKKQNIEVISKRFVENTSTKFISLKEIQNAIPNQDIDLEIKAYLDSVSGINLNILEKFKPILGYLRVTPEGLSSAVITQPICNTIKGKVHYHEFPGKGGIDFSSLLKVLQEKKYQGFITVELYNHVDVWQTVLPESRAYLLNCM